MGSDLGVYGSRGRCSQRDQNQGKVKAMPQEQIPLLEAETSWFHVFRAMVESGDVKTLGPNAVTVYLVIKSYTNWKTGKSRPDISLISDKTGLSKETVLRALKKLEEHQYVYREKVGRKNVYTLREKIEIQDGDGRPAAVATFDYLPSIMREASAELKNFLLTGKKDGLSIVHIEQLTLNIQQIFGGEGTQNNTSLDPQKYPHVKHLVEKLEAARKGKKE